MGLSIEDFVGTPNIPYSVVVVCVYGISKSRYYNYFGQCSGHPNVFMILMGRDWVELSGLTEQDHLPKPQPQSM
jgi:hypothetical protein